MTRAPTGTTGRATRATWYDGRVEEGPAQERRDTVGTSAEGDSARGNRVTSCEQWSRDGSLCRANVIK